MRQSDKVTKWKSVHFLKKAFFEGKLAIFFVVFVFLYFCLFSFWKYLFSVVHPTPRESRLAQTVNRKRPFTRRIENRPKTTRQGGGVLRRDDFQNERFSKKKVFKSTKNDSNLPSKKAFLKMEKAAKKFHFPIPKTSFFIPKKFHFWRQKQHFWCVHSHRGGGALVSGVLVPMDASKMLFLAKIGNYFTFEVRSETFSLFHFWSTIEKTVFGKNRKLVFGKNQKYFFTSKNGTFPLFQFPHFFKKAFCEGKLLSFFVFLKTFFWKLNFFTFPIF